MSRALVTGSHEITLRTGGFTVHKKLRTSFSMPERGGSITTASKFPIFDNIEAEFSLTHFSPLIPYES